MSAKFDTEQAPAAPQLATGPLMRSPETIQALRTLLAQAERGEVLGAVILSSKKDPRDIGWTIVGALNGGAMLGELAMAGRYVEDLEVRNRRLKRR